MPELTFEYVPRPEFMDLHTRQQRWACMVVHRRGGKTVACVNELLTRAAYTQKKDARFAYIAPFYRQAKDVAWQYLKNFGENVIVKVREAELRVELFNGAQITLYGADNPDALRGLYLDGVVLDEYGDSRPSLWGTVVLPTLVDRKGWAIFIGTPKGKNHFYEVAKRAQEEDGWYYLNLKASQSGIIDEEELNEMKAQMSPEEFQQEMECDFEAAVKGTYYADQINKLEVKGTIGPVGNGIVQPYIPEQNVYVASDLGYKDNCAWWFWQDGDGGPSIIDYYESSGKLVDHYVDMLRSKGYTYETIWLPHDSVAKTMATKRSTIEQFMDAGFPCKKVPRLSVQHGIDAARKVLPLCTINRDTCYDGIEALRAYRRRWDEVLRVFSDKPLHDWSSDGADGFRYLSLVCELHERDRVETTTKEPLFKPPKYQLETLFAAHENSGGSRQFQKLRM